MKQRWITAICLVAVLFPILYFGGWVFLAAAFVVLEISCYEMTRLMNRQWPAIFNISMYLCLAALLVGGYYGPQWFQVADMAVLIYLFAWLVFSPRIKLDEIAMMFVYFNLFGLLFMALNSFYAISRWLIFLMLAGTNVTDAFALFIGKAWGRHKMDERISPHKTWEGALGGYLCGAVVTFVFGYCVIQRPLILIILAAVLEPAVGQVGDLAFSAIKRHFGVKDFGNILPGHGGIMDRLDSICFNTILLYALVLAFL